MAFQFTFNTKVSDLFGEINTQMNWVSPATDKELQTEFQNKFGVYEFSFAKVSATKWLDNRGNN